MSTTTVESPSVAPASLPAVRPSLKLVGLHIRGLKSIRALDLPEDGLGWQGKVPDVMLVGGINGCGKTTLLNFLSDALELLFNPHDRRAINSISAKEAVIEFDIQSDEIPPTRISFLVGDDAFIQEHRTNNSWWLAIQGGHASLPSGRTMAIFKSPSWADVITRLKIPSVLYIPSGERTLVIPPETYKAAGKITEANKFVYRWSPPRNWKDSPEAMLYSLRWADLNAKEEGRPADATHFAPYAEAFRQFTGGEKELIWKNGELVIRITKTGATHDLSELSSGEKQVLLLTGELLRHWRPGSLILIDEPELHLHPRWQDQFYLALCHWQKERGGQVILATHSRQFVHLAGSGTGVLLGMEPL